MLAIKKITQRKSTFLHFVGTLLLLISCGKHTFDTPNSAMAQVTFCNDSSYKVTIYQDYFGGPILAEDLLPADCFDAEVNPSDNYGAGSVFSIEYWHLIENDILVGGKDPDRQITQNLKAGENPVISIPQPKNLDLQESFIRVFNASGMDLELNCLNVAFYPVNGELPIPSNKSGFYRGNNVKNTSCFSNDNVKDLTVRQGLQTQYPFPEFTMTNGYIYNFKFDGKEVIQNETEKIILQ